MSTSQILSKAELLNHWQGHRRLTRRVIEAFPEDKLFTFSVGGMRPFAELAKEMLSMAVPGLQGIVNRTESAYEESLPDITTKEKLLHQWDEATPHIDMLFNQISEADFHETFNLFGQYNFPVIENILYFIDNEIHHRAQGYVYLRALEIQPPFFWER
ncbi:DinB family protein [Parapedobacter defluvii]|uniref:DinB family protein n=1 Tax=Parapedobacter defluvii TaxID=2045106 RepID=UPI00333FEB11